MKRFWLFFLLAFLFLIAHAHAQTVTATGNLSAWTSIVNSVITSLVGVALTIGTALITKYVKDQNMRAALTAALTVATGKAAAIGQEEGDQFLQSTAVKNKALSAGLDYLADQVPAAMAHFGLTTADMTTKLNAFIAAHLNLATPNPPTPTVVVSVPATPENAEAVGASVTAGASGTATPAKPA